MGSGLKMPCSSSGFSSTRNSAHLQRPPRSQLSIGTSMAILGHSWNAAFNTKAGEVLDKTAQRHDSAEFVTFLADIIANEPHGKQIDVIAENRSAQSWCPIQ